jgi:hypothetical protein
MRVVFTERWKGYTCAPKDVQCLSLCPWRYFHAPAWTLSLPEALGSGRESSRDNAVLSSPSCTLQVYLHLEHATNVVNRLLRETGRLSSAPIFVVGVFTGKDKLGEGFGSSLKMAEYRVRRARLYPPCPVSSLRGSVTHTSYE